MLKEERAAIRRRLRDAVYELCELPAYKPRACVDRSLKDLPAALDALDEMEILIEAEKAKRPIEITGDAATSAILALELSEMQADRDRWMHMALALKKLGFGSDRKAIAKDRDQWKAQAEARDRALRSQDEHCYTCKHFGIKDGAEHCAMEMPCVDGQFWEFAQERFGKEQSNE